MNELEQIPAGGRTIPEMLRDRLQELLPKLPADVAEACGKELWVYVEPRVVSRPGCRIAPRTKTRKRASHCVECGLPLYTSPNKSRVGDLPEDRLPGAVKHGGWDRCQPCFKAFKRANPEWAVKP